MVSLWRESEESFAAPRRLFHSSWPNTQILENALANARRLCLRRANWCPLGDIVGGTKAWIYCSDWVVFCLRYR
jgi:hypothetical protein